MSRGPGSIERRIADLFAATRDRALDIETIARHAFELRPEQSPTRVQRLSATRAAHRVLRRVREMDARQDVLRAEAHAATKAALGRERHDGGDAAYDDLFERQPAFKRAEVLSAAVRRIGTWMRWWQDEARPGWYRSELFSWQAITLNGRLRFHPADVPAQVWAITIDRSGVHWFEAEVTKVTARNVMVRYKGVIARLDRGCLFRWWAWWRGVRFVSSQTGRIAAALEEEWHSRYGKVGAPPPAMQMPLDQARHLLGVPENYTRADVMRAFRRAALKAHPDHGGTAEMFRLLVEARDRLLGAIGTNAPPPKPPNYASPGVRIVYRSGSGASSRQRLGSGTRRLTASRR
jgi:hypothetical protein